MNDLALVEHVVLQGYYEIVDELPIHIGKEIVKHRDELPKEHIDELVLHLGRQLLIEAELIYDKLVVVAEGDPQLRLDALVEIDGKEFVLVRRL